ncbi:hypothetical protein FRC07_003866 [Ceratobasidium sp. 392]|nr:hypothetical protein FRC07_003866 [Ceratobasidium sp. 392]
MAPIASTTESAPVEKKSVNLGRVVGPVLGCLVGIIIGVTISICYVRRRRCRPDSDLHIPLASTSAFDLLAGEQQRHTTSRAQETTTAPADQLRRGSLGVGIVTTITSAVATRGRLQLHDGSALGQSSSEKNEPSTTPSELSPTAGPLTPVARVAPASDSSQPRSPVGIQNLEQRAEELSAPELERLAVLVARRLERVRGAPPQYQATDDAR